MEPLDFGSAETQNVEDLGYEEPGYSNDETIAAKRYDQYPTISDKRKALIFDLQNNVLPDEEKHALPLFFLTWIEKIPLGVIEKMQNGGFKIDLNKVKSTMERQALTKFISEGGDALSSKSMSEVQKIIKSVAREVITHISAKNRVAHKTLLNMFKSGKLREIINFNLKHHHYDLFGEKWVNSLIIPILDEIGKIHAQEKEDAKRMISLRESIRRIFDI